MARGGKPGEVLVHTAEEMDADLIVVGTRGYGKLRRALMGSVSAYVTNHAHCPVLVCRPKRRSRADSEGSLRSTSFTSTDSATNRKRHDSNQSSSSLDDSHRKKKTLISFKLPGLRRRTSSNKDEADQNLCDATQDDKGDNMPSEPQ